MSLFDDEPVAVKAPPKAKPTPTATVPLASQAQVEELVQQFGFDTEFARNLTRQKASTVLDRCHKERFSAKCVGAARAAQQGEGTGAPNTRELVARLDAAACLGQDLAAGTPEEVLFALGHAFYALTRTEVRDVALLVKNQLQMHPTTGEELVHPSAGRGSAEEYEEVASS